MVKIITIYGKTFEWKSCVVRVGNDYLLAVACLLTHIADQLGYA